MTSARAFDQFSAENTDEEEGEYLGEELSDIDTSQEEEIKEIKSKKEKPSTTKKKNPQESLKPYVKRSILTEDFLPIRPMANQIPQEPNSSNGKKDTKRGKKNQNQPQENNDKKDKEIKSRKKREKGEAAVKEKPTKATSGEKAKAIKVTPATENKGKGKGKASKKISTGGHDNKQQIADSDQLNKVNGGKIDKPKSPRKKRENIIDPAYKIWEQYCMHKNQANLYMSQLLNYR